jgi:hypothetical protein
MYVVLYRISETSWLLESLRDITKLRVNPLHHHRIFLNFLSHDSLFWIFYRFLLMWLVKRWTILNLVFQNIWNYQRVWTRTLNLIKDSFQRVNTILGKKIQQRFRTNCFKYEWSLISFLSLIIIIIYFWPTSYIKMIMVEYNETKNRVDNTWQHKT